VWPSQAAQARQRGRCIGPGEDRENLGVLHLGRIAATGPFGKSRTAHPRMTCCLPAASADEAEQGKHEDDDQDDPEDAHAPLLPVSELLLGRTGEKRASSPPGYEGYVSRFSNQWCAYGSSLKAATSS
jgi:hypothetical protein